DPLAQLDADLEPPQSELKELQARFDAEERTALIQPLESWLSAYRKAYPDDAAVAGTLLGACAYHAGDFDRAYRAWSEVVREHPHHPIRHRARFNMIDPEAWPAGHHPDILGADPPGPEFRRPVVPYPEVRAQNLDAVATDPRYVRL